MSPCSQYHEMVRRRKEFEFVKKEENLDVQLLLLQGARCCDDCSKNQFVRCSILREHGFSRVEGCVSWVKR